MYDVHIAKRPAVGSIAKSKSPNEIRITLSVCSCYNSERITFITARAERVAVILDITTKDLECAAVTATLTGKPYVVACYKQRDIAETKLVQLEAQTPFIARSCHSFDIVDER